MSKATSEGVGVHETVGRRARVRRFADHKFVECHSRRCDLEDGALGPDGRRSPKEIVTGGVLIGALCVGVSSEQPQ